MNAQIRAIEYYLPDTTLTSEEIALQFPEWGVEKIVEKTGISCRNIAAPDECSSDLAVAAALRLFATGVCKPAEIDYVLLCTQSPDYFLPTSACLIQDRLGIPTGSGAIDFNLGCSGYVYGLGLAKGLIETGQASRVLLLTAETYSKVMRHDDKSVRTIFGDGATATLVQGSECGTSHVSIGPFVYGTDGSGGVNLIVREGAFRNRAAAGPAEQVPGLYMNGPEVFAFTLRAVPAAVRALLEKASLQMSDIDLFVFHQANAHILRHLQRKIGIPDSKYCISMENVGNTVSSTIPIALKQAETDGVLRPGMLAMLAGFGVGYSWGATLVRWG